MYFNCRLIAEREFFKKEYHNLLKADQYSVNRGELSEFIHIQCKCLEENAFSVYYQKDGYGALLRLYKDRLIETPWQNNFTRNLINEFYIYRRGGGEVIKCPSCNRHIAYADYYDDPTRNYNTPEHRPTYFLFQNSIVYKSVDFWKHLKLFLFNNGIEYEFSHFLRKILWHLK